MSTKRHPESDHSDLRRQVKLLNLADYVKRVVDEAPALTRAQRTDLARIIRAGKPSGSVK